jgi:osmoprotectant transport system substrate-binding protein
MRRPLGIAVAAATLIGVAGLGSSASRSSSPPTTPPHQAVLTADTSRTVIIGSANFPESEILADIYADALAKAGARVVTKLDIGSREIYFKEMQNGALNVFPEYNGALLDYLDPSSTASSTAAVTSALTAALPPTLKVLRPSAAQDADSITVTAAFAAKHHLRSIGDLKPIENQVTIGAASVFATREQGLIGLKKLYGITLKLRLLDESGLSISPRLTMVPFRLPTSSRQTQQSASTTLCPWPIQSICSPPKTSSRSSITMSPRHL